MPAAAYARARRGWEREEIPREAGVTSLACCSFEPLLLSRSVVPGRGVWIWRLEEVPSTATVLVMARSDLLPGSHHGRWIRWCVDGWGTTLELTGRHGGFEDEVDCMGRLQERKTCCACSSGITKTMRDRHQSLATLVDLPARGVIPTNDIRHLPDRESPST